MIAIKVEPYKHPEIINIASTLNSLQKEVGGTISSIIVLNDLSKQGSNTLHLIYNKFSKKIGLPGNRIFEDEIIAGPFIVCEFDCEGNSVDISSLNVEHVKNLFYEPENIVKTKLSGISDEYVYYKKDAGDNYD